MENVMKRLLQDVPFEDALERTRQALRFQGFGIFTEMDIQAIFRQRLHQETPSHTVLGACYATVAFEALQEEPDFAVLLPCNVVVRDVDEGSEVTALLPSALTSLTGKTQMERALAVEFRLKAAFNSL